MKKVIYIIFFMATSLNLFSQINLWKEYRPPNYIDKCDEFPTFKDEIHFNFTIEDKLNFPVEREIELDIDFDDVRNKDYEIKLKTDVNEEIKWLFVKFDSNKVYLKVNELYTGTNSLDGNLYIIAQKYNCIDTLVDLEIDYDLRLSPSWALLNGIDVTMGNTSFDFQQSKHDKLSFNDEVSTWSNYNIALDLITISGTYEEYGASISFPLVYKINHLETSLEGLEVADFSELSLEVRTKVPFIFINTDVDMLRNLFLTTGFSFAGLNFYSNIEFKESEYQHLVKEISNKSTWWAGLEFKQFKYFSISGRYYLVNTYDTYESKSSDENKIGQILFGFNRFELSFAVNFDGKLNDLIFGR